MISPGSTSRLHGKSRRSLTRKLLHWYLAKQLSLTRVWRRLRTETKGFIGGPPMLRRRRMVQTRNSSGNLANRERNRILSTMLVENQVGGQGTPCPYFREPGVW